MVELERSGEPPRTPPQLDDCNGRGTAGVPLQLIRMSDGRLGAAPPRASRPVTVTTCSIDPTVLPADVVADRAASDRKTPYLRRMGLVRLEEAADGALDRVPTPASAERFRERATAEVGAARTP